MHQKKKKACGGVTCNEHTCSARGGREFFESSMEEAGMSLQTKKCQVLPQRAAWEGRALVGAAGRGGTTDSGNHPDIK